MKNNDDKNRSHVESDHIEYAIDRPGKITKKWVNPQLKELDLKDTEMGSKMGSDGGFPAGFSAS